MSFKCVSTKNVPNSEVDETIRFKSKSSNLGKTDAQQFMEKISKNTRNTKLRFLIFLPDSDYRKWLFSYKDLLYYRRNQFPGKLILERFEESDGLPYTVEGPVMPRQVYIMLPKEKIYIPSNQFTERYIRSKMRELVQIFVYLRASFIKFTSYNLSEEMQSFQSDIAVEIPHVYNRSGVVHSNDESKKTGTEYEIKLIPTDKPIDLNVFDNSRDFYYLRREASWRDMILRKMDGHVILDKYTFWNKEVEIFTSKFFQRLKCFDLNIEYDWNKYNDFRVDYEVKYCNLI